MLNTNHFFKTCAEKLSILNLVWSVKNFSVKPSLMNSYGAGWLTLKSLWSGWFWCVVQESRNCSSVSGSIRLRAVSPKLFRTPMLAPSWKQGRIKRRHSLKRLCYEMNIFFWWPIKLNQYFQYMRWWFFKIIFVFIAKKINCQIVTCFFENTY